jgi:quercetin dioxygenase-like cupin family protein
MIIKKGNNSLIYNIEGASGVMIHSQNHCEYVSLTLEPGSKIEGHYLPLPATFYIIKGNPTAVIDGKNFEANEGDLLEVDKDVQRGWHNNSNTTAEILVVKHL